MLKQRVLTALILVPLVLWALFSLNDDALFVLFAVIVLAGAFEWLQLAELTKLHERFIFIFVQFLFCGFVWYVAKHNTELSIIILASVTMVWLLIVLWLVFYEKGVINSRLGKISRVLLSYILLPSCLLSIGFILKNFTNDRFIILLLFTLIWGADVFAYFSGRAFGKHKLAPSISPGKSWEGVIGALIGCFVVAIVASSLLAYPGQVRTMFVAFCLIIVLISVAGDLFESLLKRQVGIKDSGNILPGHGGVLDRIDSLISSAPVFSLGMYLLVVAA